MMCAMSFCHQPSLIFVLHAVRFIWIVRIVTMYLVTWTQSNHAEMA